VCDAAADLAGARSRTRSACGSHDGLVRHGPVPQSVIEERELACSPRGWAAALREARQPLLPWPWAGVAEVPVRIAEAHVPGPAGKVEALRGHAVPRRAGLGTRPGTRRVRTGPAAQVRPRERHIRLVGDQLASSVQELSVASVHAQQVIMRAGSRPVLAALAIQTPRWRHLANARPRLVVRWAPGLP
jgi:hypothetical protein